MTSPILSTGIFMVMIRDIHCISCGRQWPPPITSRMVLQLHLKFHSHTERRNPVELGVQLQSGEEMHGCPPSLKSMSPYASCGTGCVGQCP